MNDKIVLAFFIEFPENDTYQRCWITNKKTKEKKNFEIIQKVNSKNNIHFFYVINHNNYNDEEIFINICSKKLGLC